VTLRRLPSFIVETSNGRWRAALPAVPASTGQVRALVSSAWMRETSSRGLKGFVT
jgi:hypothetical protein